MSARKYTTVQETLEAVPDKRKARGQRHSWSLLVTLIASAMSSGASGGGAIYRWIVARQEELLAKLQPDHGLPSESTVRRAVRQMPVIELEAANSSYLSQTSPAYGASGSASSQSWQGQSIDGKDVRGLRKHGQQLHLVSLVRHADVVVQGQVAVVDKRGEVSAVPTLLAGRDLRGTVTTFDALLTQRTICQQILEQGGHYLAVVKANQTTLYQDIALLFTGGAWTVQEKAQEYQRCVQYEKGHGRIETRTVEASSTLVGYSDWPGAQQVLRRHCRRHVVKTGKTTESVTYAITSLSPDQADVETVAHPWRSHRTIENRLHYVRDVTMGEDGCQAHTGNTPHVLAALRNLLLSRLRLEGWHSIPDAFAFYSASLDRTLDLIGYRSPPSL